MSDYLDPEPAADNDELDLLACILNGWDPSDVDLTPDAFRDPKLEATWRAACKVAAAGNTVNLATVRMALGASGDKAASWLYDVLQRPIVPSNAPPLAARVKRAADLRALVALGRRILQEASMDGAEPEKVVDLLRKAADEPMGTVRGTETVQDAIPRVVDQIQRGVVAGLSTPWPDLDRKIHGLADDRLYIVAARPGVGKALALDTPLVTPTGWTTMGQVEVGDYLIGMDGKPTRVVGATDVMTERPCYRVTFDDGESIVADAQHQWLTSTRASRRAANPPAGNGASRHLTNSIDQRWKNERPSVKTTEQIAATLRVGSDDRLNHAVDLPAPIEGADIPLPIDPYVLGAWLGDGSSAGPQITSADPQILDEIRAAGYPVRSLTDPLLYSMASPRGRNAKGYVAATGMGAELLALGLVRNKHIPAAYLRASFAQRLALLQGLMDTDGTVSQSGRCSFDVTSRALAEGALEIIRSLGVKAYMRTKAVEGATEASSTCYMVGFTTSLPVFRLQRKLDRLPRTTRFGHRMITSVVPVPSVPVRCVEVDNADHMYLAGEAMVPTHNSLLGQGLAMHWAQRHGLPTYFASLEMSTDELTMRALAQASRVDLDYMLSGDMSERLWNQLGEKIPVWGADLIHVCDDPGQTLESIRNGARNLQRRNGLGLIVVDYLQLVTPSDRRANREQQVAALSRGLKLLAKELHVPVVAMSQVRRQAEGERNKRPTMNDLRESGAIEQDADAVLILHIPEPKEPGEGELYVAKARAGRRGGLPLQMLTSWASVVPSARAYSDDQQAPIEDYRPKAIGA